MSNNFKLIVLLILCFLTQNIYSQIVFQDDFGQTTSRVESPYMPKVNGFTFADTSSFPKIRIDEDYYTVIDPRRIGDPWPANFDWFWTGPAPSGSSSSLNHPATTDHTGNPNGAVMVVNNGGANSGFFYLRNFSFDDNSIYKLTLWVYVVNPNGEVEFGLSDYSGNDLLGGGRLTSPLFTTNNNQWREITFYFRTPISCTHKDAKIELYNGDLSGTNLFNTDYYVDDISLEKVSSAPGGTPTIICPSVSSPLQAVSDAFTVSPSSTSVTSVLANDLYNGGQATTGNVDITQISTTNSGISIDTSTGNVVVAAGTPSGVYNLVYRISKKIQQNDYDEAIITVTVPSAINPGGVSGTSLWLKANEGVTSSGTNLIGWVDQAGVNTFTVTGTPTYNTNAINFNQAVSFNNDGFSSALPTNRLDGNTNIDYVTAFAVYKFDDNSFGQSNFLGSSISPLNTGVVLFGGNNENSAWSRNGNSIVGAGAGFHIQDTSLNNIKFNIVSLDASTQTPFGTGRVNGKNGSIVNGQQDFDVINFRPMIGGSNHNGNNDFGHMKGNGLLAEVIVFPTAKTISEKANVESYLAIKYGITLDSSIGSYVNSNGGSIWNNAGYWHDVFGIGKDDVSGLNQPQSNSINTGSGNGTGQSGKGNIVLSNPSNLENLEFLMIGHDNTALAEQATDLPIALSSLNARRLTREWKVSQASQVVGNDIGNVTLRFDLTGLTISGNTSNVNDFRILVDLDGDGNFTTGTVNQIVPDLIAGSRIIFNALNLPDRAVFSFVTGFQQLDADQDGIADAADLDDDNDGILDTVECNLFSSRNAGFEIPNITLAPYNSTTWTLVNQVNAGGWQTTAGDGLIEFWRSGFNGVPAAEGNQFVELNANVVSTLYQNFALSGNAGTITWSIKHRGRSGVDVANVRMGTSLANALASPVVATMSDGNTAWGTYTGSYNVVAGQTNLTIAFQSVSSVGGASYGNFLDDVQFVFSECIDTDGDGIPNSLDVDSDNDGCPDAIEGSENVKYNQIHNLNLPLADPNYAYRGQIKVTYNGTTTSTPSA
ncbi:hypothetical protein, partial [Cloacibacterium rupense]